MNASLSSRLSNLLSAAEMNNVLQSVSAINTLPISLRDPTRSQFGEMYNEQMRIVIGLAVAEFLTTLLIWKKNPAETSGT
jgi:hypothetical protein